MYVGDFLDDDDGPAHNKQDWKRLSQWAGAAVTEIYSVHMLSWEETGSSFCSFSDAICWGDATLNTQHTPSLCIRVWVQNDWQKKLQQWKEVEETHSSPPSHPPPIESLKYQFGHQGQTNTSETQRLQQQGQKISDRKEIDLLHCLYGVSSSLV